MLKIATKKVYIALFDRRRNMPVMPPVVIKNDYEFFRHSMLVNDIIVNANRMSIPYDMLFEVITESYNDYCNYYEMLADAYLNSPTFCPYENECRYIENNVKLRAQLDRMKG